jgi:hypothetical protein
MWTICMNVREAVTSYICMVICNPRAVLSALHRMDLMLSNGWKVRKKIAASVPPDVCDAIIP